MDVDDAVRQDWIMRVLGIDLQGLADGARRERRRALLAAVAALTDPPCADTDELAALARARAAANGALADELPTPEQVTAAEQAIAAFTDTREQAVARAGRQRRALLAQVAALADPAFADEAASAALGRARDAANAALADDLPTPQLLAAAEAATAAFARARDEAAERAAARRAALLRAIAGMADPPFAEDPALAALKLDWEAAEKALADAAPTPQRFAEAERAIAAFGTKLAAEQLRVAEKRRALLPELEKLLDPPFADDAATAALGIERDAAIRSLAPELPTPAQFAEAGRAIAAFPPLVEAAKQRASEKLNALLVTLGTLEDPSYAEAEALGALKIARDKASGALADETPTGQQIKDAEAAIADWGLRLEAEKARVAERRRALQEKVGQLLTPDFADQAAADALTLERDAATLALADALPTPAQFIEAARAIAAFATALGAATKRITDKCHELRGKLASLGDPAGADVDEKQAMKPARDTAMSALTAETPLPDQMAAAEKAIALLARLVNQSANMAALVTAGHPQAAAAARTAFKAFKAVNGDAEITSEMVADVRQATAAAQAKIQVATDAWNAAQALPEDTTEEIEQKRLAIEAAENEYTLVTQERDAATDRENAVFGQHALTQAVAHGPLSAESGRPFDDATAELLIKGFQNDSRLAATAVEAATTARYPETIAQGLAWVTEKMQGGFASAGGTSWIDPEYARGYGGDLLKMAGNVGPAYYDSLEGYIASGRQFTSEPLGNEDAMAWSKVSQQRSVAVASALVQPDGAIDLTTDAAKNAIGDALYHPKSLENATPALSAQILETAAFLQDGTTGPQAEAVLQGMGAPEAGKGSETLVRRALGSPRPNGKADTDPIEASDARVAVMASMLKPLDQGPVGSCFSTAPARLVREQQPIEAMKAFAQIASDGTYKPANGEKVPVVTNLPADEDPIMRGWEYSLATAAVRTGATTEKSEFTTNLGLGIDQLKDVAVPAGLNQDKIWANKKKKLKGYIENAFTFTYDPTWEVTDANDGSSSTGRYVVQRKSGGREIRTKDDFIDQMTDVAVRSLGLRTTEEETKVRDLVKSDAFINAVCPDKYKPWELPSGGRASNVVTALNGTGVAYSGLAAEAPKTTPPQDEGVRTREVLESFLDGLGGGTDEMVTVDTAGMHSFNALPSHPSLLLLKGANPTETAQKVQTNLIDKGQALKNTDLTAERAAWMFDQEVTKALVGQSDPALKTLIEEGARAKRPTAPMKPDALKTAIREAMAGLHQKVAETHAADWKLSEEAEGRTVDSAALDKKKADLEKEFDKSAEGSAKGTMMRDLDVPEFVIADTNWGDCRNHVYFVIAPDPTTGDPVLWKKTEPPGSLEPAGRAWVDAQWDSLK